MKVSICIYFVKYFKQLNRKVPMYNAMKTELCNTKIIWGQILHKIVQNITIITSSNRSKNSPRIREENKPY